MVRKTATDRQQNKVDIPPTPPSDTDAEKSVLGSLLWALVHNDADGFKKIIDTGVSAPDFMFESHAQIFDIVAGMRDDVQVADTGLIVSKLKAGGLTKKSDEDKIIGLMDSVPHAMAGPYHAQQVLDCSYRRRLLTITDSIRHAANNGHDLPDVLDEADRLAGLVAEARRATRSGAAVTVNLADVQAEPIRWLWWQRIALGKLTLIAGDPGLGKSFLTMDLAARVSRGAGWPDLPGAPTEAGGVVLLSAEDDVADTIRPRLDAAGADVSRIVALQAVNTAQGARTFDLARDLAALEQVITDRADVRLIVVDPITAYCGKTDSHNNTEVRGLLAPLAELASRHRVAVVAVTHLNKSGAGPAIYRTMGSLAFAAAARAVWAVTKDKDDPDRRLLLPVKNNIGADRSGLAFALHNAPDVPAPAVAWEAEPIDTTADSALSDDAGEPSKSDEAAEFLRATLADGPLPASEVEQQAKQAGIAWRTVQRAKRDAGVRSVQQRDGDHVAGWVWEIKQ